MTAAVEAMAEQDVEHADDLWVSAFAPQDTAGTGSSRTREEVNWDRARLRHVLATDPHGSFVAKEMGHLVGFSQSTRRAHRFVLSRLGVRPDRQDRGVGAALLHEALSYAEGSAEQYIYSSKDPRALHSYVREGFALHPAVRISGVRRDVGPPSIAPPSIAPPSSIEFVDPRHLSDVVQLDGEVRAGSSREQDLQFWARQGARFVLDRDGAYAVVHEGRVTTLGALEVSLARRLFSCLLMGFRGLEPVSVGFVVAEQQWAISAASDCRATISPSGAVMTRNVGAVAASYLPNPMLG